MEGVCQLSSRIVGWIMLFKGVEDNAFKND
jgi:hypothetical protein